MLGGEGRCELCGDGLRLDDAGGEIETIELERESFLMLRLRASSILSRCFRANAMVLDTSGVAVLTGE